MIRKCETLCSCDTICLEPHAVGDCPSLARELRDSIHRVRYPAVLPAGRRITIVEPNYRSELA